MQSKAPNNTMLIIAGPTASGKSALAMGLAEHLRLEIINGDSVQVYRGLDIGSAKPTCDEQSKVKHHLIDIMNPDQILTAYSFMNLAREKASEIAGRGILPVMVGGSPFFINAAVNGLDEMAPADHRFRKVLNRYAAAFGTKALYNRLKKLDSDAAEGISGNDLFRISRRMEILKSTGKSWRDQPVTRTPISMNVITIMLLPERQELYKRIEKRVDEMVEMGLIDEVADLIENWPEDSPAFNSIGYKQTIMYLKEECSLDEAKELICRDTRRLAKRQITWFKKWKGASFYHGDLIQAVKSSHSDIIEDERLVIFRK